MAEPYKDFPSYEQYLLFAPLEDMDASERRAHYYLDILQQRGIESFDDMCHHCRGLGVRTYGSTATWRGGIGGQLFTSDVCDKCWGSGHRHKPWPSWKKYNS